MTTTFTSGNDTFTVPAGQGTYDLDFLAGDDVLTVKGGDFTTAHMGDGNDVVTLRSGDASVFGEAGNDRFELYADGIEADGGDGADLFNVRAGADAVLHGGIGNDRFNFYGSATDIVVNGDAGDDDFFGYYHSVSGTIFGGAGNDYFVQFVSGVTLTGGLGNDIYRVTVGSPASFSENPGEGTDSVQVARGDSYTLPANIENLSVQGFSGSVLTPATLNGNALNNHIVAHNNDETIFGFDGNDSLSGKGGNDALYGGNGSDILDGGTGNDTLDGRAGNDTLQGRSGDDSMTGGTGNDTYYVDSLSDQVFESIGEGTDTVRMSVDTYFLPDNVENAIVESTSSGTALYGNGLDNQLTGNAGPDFLSGLDGSDTLRGGGGNDALTGYSGSDTLTGGSGNDGFYFLDISDSTPSAPDSITDFTPNGSGTGDVLDFSNIDADTTTDGNQAFDFGGNVAGAHHAWYTATVNGDGSYDVIWYGDVNGDGVADFELHVHQIGAASIGGAGSDIVL